MKMSVFLTAAARGMCFEIQVTNGTIADGRGSKTHSFIDAALSGEVIDRSH
jgi:hypothetical protein